VRPKNLIRPSLPIKTDALAADVFGAQLATATRYVAWLSGPGVERGLIGPNEAGRLWERHLLNCAVVAALIPPGSTVIDIGSGAGLPGIALALARPDLSLALVESMARRTAFLDDVVADLGLANVRVQRARAEELASARLSADVVVCRAVAPTGRLAGWAAPLLRSGGQLLALKGAGVAAELAEEWPTIRQAGMAMGATLAVISAAGDGPGAVWLPAVRVAEQAFWPSNSGADTPSTALAGVPAEQHGAGETEEALAVVVRLNRGAPGLSQRPSSGLG
jgi:16S rRNA (guanine527-N7)-methyltransferase